jgi:hypothetical protein
MAHRVVIRWGKPVGRRSMTMGWGKLSAVTGLDSRMLKESLFSPAESWRAETRLIPCGVLASHRGSTYRTIRLASSLASALLDRLFGQPVWSSPVAQDVWTIECTGMAKIVIPQPATEIQARHSTEMSG